GKSRRGRVRFFIRICPLQLPLVVIGRLWARAYAIRVLEDQDEKNLPDDKDEVLRELFGSWIRLQAMRGSIVQAIQSGIAQRAGESWPREPLDAIDTATLEFECPQISPRTELDRCKRFVKPVGTHFPLVMAMGLACSVFSRGNRAVIISHVGQRIVDRPEAKGVFVMPQFSLRAILLLMAAVGTFFAGAAWQVRRDRELIQEYERRERELADIPFLIPKAKAGQSFVPLRELVADGQGGR
ncbi:MAG: hypothetical protein ACREHD_24455, partial [Pirellulales bacterium]